MRASVIESFFLPDEYSSQSGRLPSATYNLACVLFNRSEQDHLFVPIRSMQYLAIIEKGSIWFVDSMAYAVKDGEGGRLIVISWHPQGAPSERDSLDQDMDCNFIFYGEERGETNRRLCTEFFQAMKEMDQRYRDTIQGSGEISILPLRSPDTAWQ